MCINELELELEIDIRYFQLSKLTARRLVVQMRSAKKTSVFPYVSVILVTRVMDSTVQVRSGSVQCYVTSTSLTH